MKWIFGIVLFFAISGSTLAQSIPYPKALENAAIIQSSLSNIDTNAIIVGNGDINGLIFAKDGQLVMQTAKNDVWDARLVTEDDMPLLKVDVKNHSWTGGGRPPSWNTPYPTQTPPVVIKIHTTGDVKNSKIDIGKAMASITTSSSEINVRALAQNNAFYFETDRKISIEGFPQDFLPAAEIIKKSGVIAVKQHFPGDPDYAGMDVFSVLKSKGNRHVVAIVTSRESDDPLKDATEMVKSILKERSEQVISAHEMVWQQYWSKSGVMLADNDLQNWWYRQLYYFRCLSKPGVYPIALQGGYNKKAGWHGTWTMNYNAEQTFWPAFNTNHYELAEPFIDLIHDYIPRARFYAKTVFDCVGGVVPHNYWPFEPDPDDCVSVNKRHFAFMPWSYGIGTAGHTAHNLWLHYDYTRDNNYLREKIYPVLKEYATFYASFIEKCRETNGVVIFGPSVDPEHTKFGWDNSPYDLAWAKHTLKAAIKAAGILKVDNNLVERWTESLGKLPYYPVIDGVVKVGDRESGYNIITPVVPLFPAEQLSWFSSDHEKDLFSNTIDWIKTRYNLNNSVVMLNVARARLSMTEDAITDTKEWFKGKEQPNGLFYWKAHGFYISEQTAVAGLITEFLIQSVNNIIRIFPSWPENKDAEFSDLRARGGFLVSAVQKDGKIDGLTIESTAGGELKLVSPWSSISVKYEDGSVKSLTPDPAGIVTINTEKGQKFEFISNPSM